jgi:hypothetical protein
LPADRGLVLHGFLPNPRPKRQAIRAPARAARMLALAHRLERDLAAGVFASAEEVARLLHVTPARVSRLRRLTLLAPDIQEEVLFLEAVDGREPVLEKWLCDAVAAHVDWQAQRLVWRDRCVRQSDNKIAMSVNADLLSATG